MTVLVGELHCRLICDSVFCAACKLVWPAFCVGRDSAAFGYNNALCGLRAWRRESLCSVARARVACTCFVGTSQGVALRAER